MEQIFQELNVLRNERSQLFESSLLGICIIDTNFIIKDVNSTFCQLVGLTKEQTIGRLCADVYGGNLCHSEECPVKRLTSGEKYHRLEREVNSCLKISCAVSSRPFYDCSGKIIGIIQEVIDITERNTANNKISQLAAIVESASDGIFSCTNDGIITYCNKGAEIIYGYPADEMLGRNIIDFFPSEKRLQMLRLMAKLRKGKTVNECEVLLRKKDQKHLNICFSAATVTDSTGKIIGVSIITKDMTEQKRIQEEISRMDRLDLVGQMAAGIGHEIRNPITTVRGFLQLLANKETDELKSEYYDIIIEELDRANTIISEFLSLARGRAVNLKSTSLNKIINTLYPLMSTDAMKQDKRIVLKKGEIPNLLLIEKEIRQMLINLVRNGLDATPTGGIITIGTYIERDEVILFVEDEGSGISPELLDRIGTPFVTTKAEGTGLGISVCLSIAEKHNAKIDIKTGSTGTTFYVKFKLNSDKRKRT